MYLKNVNEANNEDVPVIQVAGFLSPKLKKVIENPNKNKPIRRPALSGTTQPCERKSEGRKTDIITRIYQSMHNRQPRRLRIPPQRPDRQFGVIHHGTGALVTLFPIPKHHRATTVRPCSRMPLSLLDREHHVDRQSGLGLGGIGGDGWEWWRSG